ncbi:hypothetical protein VHEMI08689 [[Torrubiella] hemipterigena]|uniref:5-hydroxyisourate hydrolase n=1 Tax=[Torrubiella] hemipterigena TaxID=1531966 RepID=A0A0A1TE87_9HYPO|nr:hypothetical protein VHEMI08689 [[Torrubiella] hemipterigena]
MAMEKDRITCHVLDTTAGRPAKGIAVRLVGPSTSQTFSSETEPSDSQAEHSYSATTDADGRIKLWKPLGMSSELSGVLAGVQGASRWTLHFDTEGYFGEGNTFFPEATIVFRVEQGQTYHVPLLLSPFTYTTYRGS